MIKISVVKKEAYYQTISITGHAMYADFGKDIVCSAVSSIVITSINGILSLDEKALHYEVIDDGIEIDTIKIETTTQTLIDNMVNLLNELAQQYPKNIQMK